MTQPCHRTDPWPPDFAPFHPRRWLMNGHLQTIVGNLGLRKHMLQTPVAQMIEIAPARGSQIASAVLCECHWQREEERSRRPTVLVLHGLEGSSRSQYVQGNTAKFWAAGCNVIRMKMRNCGGTERLSPTLYHSGMSGDVGAVMNFFLRTEKLESFALIGYSMGGNLVLKLAGELGANPPAQLCAVVGISPAIDLAVSADTLHQPGNRFYERRFLRALSSRFRRKAFLFPRAFDPRRSEGIRSIREFDERITALYCGFQGADDYYHRASAARVLDAIRVPTLLLHACDDPFVRLTPETRDLLQANPQITLLETDHGGHCAFLAASDLANDDDGYWAEATALRFVLGHTPTPPRAPSTR